MVVAAVATGVWLLMGAACGVVAVGLAEDLRDHQLGRAVCLGVVGSVAGGIVGLLLVGEQGPMHPGAWPASIGGAGAVLAVASLVRSRRRT